jgi:hypothetical protein
MGRKGGRYVRTSGHVITEYHDGRPARIDETVQCVHCQRHRVYTPATLKKDWAWCMLCAGTVCNRPECADRCVPAEQELENLEQGRPEGYRRIIVSGGFDRGDRAAGQ